MSKFVDHDEIARLHAAGWSAAKIADHLGCSTKTVHRWRVANGKAQPAKQRRPDEDRQKLRELIEDGASINEAAKTLGIAWKDARRWAPEAPVLSRAEVIERAMMGRQAARLYRKGT